jgi:hypothetical protein
MRCTQKLLFSCQPLRKPDCYLVTSQLKIYSPILPSDDTQVEATTTLPDLSGVMDDLEEYMQVNHQINMTSLFADFSKLQESISIETIDVQSVQDTLKKVSIMKDLDNFDPTQLHLEKLSHLSTWTAVHNSSASRSRYMLLLLLPLPSLLRPMHYMFMHQSLQMHASTENS